MYTADPNSTGSSYNVIETSDPVYIGKDYPDEFTGYEDTKQLRGAAAKAKANAAQGLPTLIQTAGNKRWQKNYKSKHNANAAYGWYRFTSRFAYRYTMKMEK